jgi:hypothetical protein
MPAGEGIWVSPYVPYSGDNLAIMLRELTDEHVHVGRGTTDDLTQDDDGASNDGDIAAAHEIRKGANKRGYGSGGKEVRSDEPHPVVETAEITVDVDRGTGCCEQDGWLVVEQQKMIVTNDKDVKMRIKKRGIPNK